MTSRLLGPDEAQLWGRVMATVRPLRPGAPNGTTPVQTLRSAATSGDTVLRKSRQSAAPAAVSGPKPTALVPKPRAGPGVTLDGGWDKRIIRGAVVPDMTLDLHGHTLSSAHAMLDHGIERALKGGCRVILLVTGKPPRPESQRPHARGAIRAAVADWLAGSRHADRIAAVRGAHPRHGGQGALYIILRRARGG